MKPLALLLAFACLACQAVSLEFRVLSWEGPLHGLKYHDGRETVEIFAHDTALSRSYRIAEGNTLRFFRETVADGQVARIPVATPTAPAGLVRGILLLAPGASADSYGGHWLEDDVEAAPPGSMRFYNYSQQPLALKTPGDQWLQAPGEAHRVAVDTSRRSVAIQVAAQVGEQWRRVVNVTQPVRPTHRLLVFLRDARPSADTPAGTLELRVLYDL